ncbi:polysaccharide deacetylase family protein [Pilimelia columellifera]|uniref:NodB homology domain-containing protein n=1 Tax=Pilimelia columellifera subsp. columellifera TaxID=706583 RepID=A0ABN3N144_9ACTN
MFTRKHLLRLSSAVLAGAALVATAAVASASTAPTFPAGVTVVSLTFDDGTMDQMTEAVPVLNRHGMKGTFFINSERIDQPDRMTEANLKTLAAGGHEIAGHTLTHPDLPKLTPEEQRKEICDDRTALLKRGFAIRNLAFPFGSASAVTGKIAQECGYSSARGVGGLKSTETCKDCPVAESIPPRDPYYTATTPSLRASTTLADMKSYVTRAEAAGGGWVQLPIHHVCNSCDDTFAVSPTLFSEFLGWLAARETSHKTVVRPVNAVINGAVAPGVPGTPAPPVGNQVRNPSMENAAGRLPTCFENAAVGISRFGISRTPDARTGDFGVTVLTTGLGRDSMVLTAKTRSCAVPGVSGRRTDLSVWYKGTWLPGSKVRMIVQYRNKAGEWVDWTSGPMLASSLRYQQARLTTPALPAGATAISFGVAINGIGTLTTDDYSAMDAR